jgi:hypothetical protein
MNDDMAADGAGSFMERIEDLEKEISSVENKLFAPKPECAEKTPSPAVSHLTHLQNRVSRCTERISKINGELDKLG